LPPPPAKKRKREHEETPRQALKKALASGLQVPGPTKSWAPSNGSTAKEVCTMRHLYVSAIH
jgi:hypothetical protein